MPVCSHIAHGCFHTAGEELNSWSTDLMACGAQRIIIVWPFNKELAKPWTRVCFLDLCSQGVWLWMLLT